jgi:hypothetical protein
MARSMKAISELRNRREEMRFKLVKIRKREIEKGKRYAQGCLEGEVYFFINFLVDGALFHF